MFVKKTIPNLFTIANLCLGVFAILFVYNGHSEWATLLVIFAMLTDGLDGRLARALDAQSEFGKELDSLSDVISFGIAPAFIMYVVAFQHMGALGIVVTVLFPICGALRLARFNVAEAPPGYFLGLPIPAAGGMLSLMALFHTEIFEWLMLGFAVMLSYLMISRIKYPNLKKIGISKRLIWFVCVFSAGLAVLAFYLDLGQFARLLLFPLALYALYGLKKSVNLLFRRKRKSKEKRKGSPGAA